MFTSLGVLLFSGLPVALVLSGVALAFGLVGWATGTVRPGDFAIIYYRVFGTLTDYDDVLWAAVPLIVFMGGILEGSGVARALMLNLSALLQRFPGGLALAATIIGIILAPAAAMVGASIATLALIALPAMLEQGYRPSFATGSVAAAGTLGVGLPPGLMLFFLASAMGLQLPYMFTSMLGPALLVLIFYTVYFAIASGLAFSPDGRREGNRLTPVVLRDLLRSVVPPIALIAVMLGVVIVGWATFAESAAFGAAAALVMVLVQGKLSRHRLGSRCSS